MILLVDTTTTRIGKGIAEELLCRGENAMILLVDTTTTRIGKGIAEELLCRGENAAGFEVIDTTGMHISHCVGCNFCWLKTAGRSVLFGRL